jgi:hypothetical protein
MLQELTSITAARVAATHCCKPCTAAYLPKFFCSFASISTRGVHKGDDGQTKLIGVPHEAHSFAVTVGLGHAKVAADVLLQAASKPSATSQHHQQHTPGYQPQMHSSLH